MRLVVSLILALVGLYAQSGTVAGACAPEVVEQRTAGASAIVYGSARQSGADEFIVTVERSLRGDLSGTVRVHSIPPKFVTSIDFVLVDGGSYTLYLTKTADGVYSADPCAGSHQGEPTARDTERAQAAGQVLPVVGAHTTEERPAAGIISSGRLTTSNLAGVALIVVGAVLIITRRRLGPR